MREVFTEANPLVDIQVASDGIEAMAYLRQEAGSLASPRPDLILLDLNLPKMDGREVLAQIKGDASLMLIPTVILTTSAADADIVHGYKLRANSYLTKPIQLDAFETLVRGINDFWLNTAKLPRRVELASA